MRFEWESTKLIPPAHRKNAMNGAQLLLGLAGFFLGIEWVSYTVWRGFGAALRDADDLF